MERRETLGPVSRFALKEVLTQKPHHSSAVLQSLCPLFLKEESLMNEVMTPSEEKKKLCVQAEQKEEFMHRFPGAGRCLGQEAERAEGEIFYRV